MSRYSKLGTRVTTKMAGKMKRTSGKTILTGAFMAWALTYWRRRSRMLSAWFLRVLPMLVPRRSAWMMEVMKSETSSRPQRSAMLRMAVRRTTPMRMSSCMRRHSSMKGPFMRAVIFDSAASKERPAWTLTQSRSSTSGS